MRDAHETAAEGAAGYDRAVLPASAGDNQRAETKRAFYAGAWWLAMQLGVGGADAARTRRVLRRVVPELARFAERGGQ